MFEEWSLHRLFNSGVFLLLVAAEAWGQQLRVDAIPTGLKPLGIDMALGGSLGLAATAVVANSGDDSVSIFSVGLLERGPNTGPKGISNLRTARGIPAPYAVKVIPPGGVALVTSPSDNSMRVLSASGSILATVQTGPEPYSVGCSPSTQYCMVSNLGDNTLLVLQGTRSPVARISGVPGSRGFHGIDVSVGSSGRNLAWVAGTDANVVTVVDLSNFSVLTQIPLSRPIAIRARGSTVAVASAGTNTITRYNRDTLQIESTTQTIQNPQDFAGSFLGTFVTNGTDMVISGQTIPGATAVAAIDFGSPFGPSTSVALVTSADTNSVYLLQTPPTNRPAQFTVANGASFAISQVATGSLASTLVSTGVSQIFFADSLPLPKTMGGVTLRIGGILNFSATAGWTYDPTGSVEAPLLFVGPGQINFQVPPGISPGTSIPAQLRLPSSTLLTTLRITATSPGIFSVLQNGQGQAAALNQDNSQNGNPQSILGAQPARRGSVIQIYATGAGETDPPLLPGEPAPASGNPLILTRVQPTVTIGGQTARVLFSGMAPGYVGLWQINAEVPANVPPGPAVPLVISAGGISSNTVTIAVE